MFLWNQRLFFFSGLCWCLLFTTCSPVAVLPSPPSCPSRFSVPWPFLPGFSPLVLPVALALPALPLHWLLKLTPVNWIKECRSKKGRFNKITCLKWHGFLQGELSTSEFVEMDNGFGESKISRWSLITTYKSSLCHHHSPLTTPHLLSKQFSFLITCKKLFPKGTAPWDLGKNWLPE